MALGLVGCGGLGAAGVSIVAVVVGLFYFGYLGGGRFVGETAVSDGRAAAIGELDADGVKLELPEQTFEDGARVKMRRVPKRTAGATDATLFTLADDPVDITLEGHDFTRTGQPVTLRFRLPESVIRGLEDESFVQLGYYFGGEWLLQPMDAVDLDAGTATATLYHFSTQVPVQLTRKKVRDEVAQDLATAEWEKKHNQRALKQAVQGTLEEIIIKMTRVKDPSVIQAIVEEAAKENTVTSLLMSGLKYEKDPTGAEAELATTLGGIALKVVAKKAGASKVEYGDEAGVFAGMVQGGTAGAEDDYEEMAKTLAKAVIGTNAIGRLFMAAAKVTEVSIASWKKNGIEEWYQAFKEGADGKYGFTDVSAGEFDRIVEQSGAIATRIQIEAVAQHCARYGVDEKSLSGERRNAIGNEALQKLKQSFISRRDQEAEIAEMKTFYTKLLDGFEKHGVDEVGDDQATFENLTYAERLQRYHNITRTILELTGRKVTRNGETDDEYISERDLAYALRGWTQSRQKGLDYLTQMGLIERQADRVKPVTVTATGQYRYGSNALNVLSISISFTNVGATQPGQGGVTGSAVDQTDGNVFRISGTFAGGPNGAMTLLANGETLRTRLVAGKTLTVPVYGTLTVKNPGAFAGME